METTTHLPAGIIDSDIEFFCVGETVFFMQDGKKHDFSELSLDAAASLREDLDNNIRALEAIELLGIADPQEELKQFVKCRYGDFDNRADLSADGVTIKEYVNCSYRGTCDYEGILCQHFYPAMHGNLTPRQIEIIKLVIMDLPDKIIADRLGISVNTMAVHRRNIEKKIGCNTKVGITAFAYRNNLI